MKAQKRRFVISVCVLVVIVMTAASLVACATEESALKEKYEQAGFAAQSFPFVQAEADKELVDFAYHGIKNANSSNIQQIFVITFKTIDSAKKYYDEHCGDDDKPNMTRYTRAVVYGSSEAVELY